MTGTLDWCISRQLWWGHRIPAWYKDNETKVQIESPEMAGFKMKMFLIRGFQVHYGLFQH